MQIPFERLLDIFNSTDNSKTDVVSLFLEYCKIKQKGEDDGNQLYLLEAQYSMIFWDFNFNSIDTLIAERGLLYKIKTELLSQEVLCMIGNMVLKSTISKILYYNHLIQLKSKTNYLQKLDYYFDNPDALAKLIS
jgi:hypothetical protein